MSANQIVKQVSVVTQTAPTANQQMEKVALFNSAGSPVTPIAQAAAQADTTAVDLAALKVDFNALLAKLRTAGVIAT